MTIASLLICTFIFSCNDGADGEGSTREDTTRQIQDTTGTLDTTIVLQSFIELSKDRARVHRIHYANPLVNPQRGRAKFADMDMGVFSALFQNQNQEVVSLRTYFAAFLNDDTVAIRRNHPTIIIGVKTKAKHATLVKETYYIASGICPPPSPCRSDLD